MKVALGYNIQEGPWGGANLFAKSLNDYLLGKGVSVVFDLVDDDIDIILLTEPRRNLLSGAFCDYDILEYLKNRNDKAVVIQRINDCDQRKEINHMNRRYIWANRCADYTVFIGEWLVPLYEESGWPGGEYAIGLNGANREVFNSSGQESYHDGQKLKLVTHHWGPNWLKGWDIYDEFDQMLGEEEWLKDFEFTYIGQLPRGFTFRNANYGQPQSGHALADCLRQHHVYLSASQFEPAGMHHIEGAMCGLPLLYRNSGALPEYCKGFGVMFDDSESFRRGLLRIKEEYFDFLKKMPDYPNDSDRMCKRFYDIFLDVQKNRDALLKPRKDKVYSSFIPKKSELLDSGKWLSDTLKAVESYHAKTPVETLSQARALSALGAINTDMSGEKMAALNFHLLSYTGSRFSGENEEDFGSFLLPAANSAKVSETFYQRLIRIFKATGKRDKLKAGTWLAAIFDQRGGMKRNYFLLANYLNHLDSEGYKIEDSLVCFIERELRSLALYKLDKTDPLAVSCWLYFLASGSRLIENGSWARDKLVSVLEGLYEGSGLYMYRGLGDFNNSMCVNAILLRALDTIEAEVNHIEDLVDVALWEIPQTDGFEFLNNLYILWKCSGSSTYRNNDIRDFADYTSGLLYEHLCEAGGFSEFAFLEGETRFSNKFRLDSTLQALEAWRWILEIKR